jgi:hypothetical protein
MDRTLRVGSAALILVAAAIINRPDGTTADDVIPTFAGLRARDRERAICAWPGGPAPGRALECA